MATSRGSIHHKIREDLIALIKSLFYTKSCKPASKKILKETSNEISSYFDTSHAIIFPFARTSLYAILKSLDLQKGSEILMTPFNISPMIDVIKNLGLKPTFVDINHEDFGPDFSSLELMLSKRPACFFVTYLFGYVPDLDYIIQLCNKYEVILIEDISHAVGAKYKNRYLGTFGYASIYSSSLTKYIDSFCGSFVLTKNEILAIKLKDFYKKLSKPSSLRIRKTIFKTLLWNIALSNLGFNLIIYPNLFLLNIFKPQILKKILNPVPFKSKKNELMKFYFEKITNIQCKYMVYYLHKLENTISSRNAKSRLICNEFEKKINFSTNNNNDNFNNTWQFLLKVKSMSETQEILFKNGIETGITKLPNLAAGENVKLKNAISLKEKFIFVPIHKNNNIYFYKNFINILLKKDQI